MWPGPLRLGTDFRKLFGSSVASNLGDGLLMAAGPLLAYSLTRDPLLVGLASFFQSLPWFLASLLSGAIVDRLDRKRVMGVANCARAAALAALGVAVLLDAAPLPVLYAALFVVGLSETFFDNASQTILPAVVGDDLEHANGRLEGARIVADDLAGPPLGGALFAVAASIPFLLNAGVLAASAALVFSMRGSFKTYAGEGGPALAPRAILSAIREGIFWLLGHPVFGPLAGISALLGVVDSGVFAVFVLYVRDVLGLGNLAFGALLAAGALGGIAAGFLTGPLVRTMGSGTAVRASLALGALSYAGIALAGAAFAATLVGAFLVGAALVANGFHLVMWNVTTLSWRQSDIPGDLLGRVNSAYRFATMTGAMAGPIAAGLLTKALGFSWLLWLAAVLLAAGALATLHVFGDRPDD